MSKNRNTRLAKAKLFALPLFTKTLFAHPSLTPYSVFHSDVPVYDKEAIIRALSDVVPQECALRNFSKVLEYFTKSTMKDQKLKFHPQKPFLSHNLLLFSLLQKHGSAPVLEACLLKGVFMKGNTSQLAILENTFGNSTSVLLSNTVHTNDILKKIPKVYLPEALMLDIANMLAWLVSDTAIGEELRAVDYVKGVLLAKHCIEKKKQTREDFPVWIDSSLEELEPLIAQFQKKYSVSDEQFKNWAIVTGLIEREKKEVVEVEEKQTFAEA